MSHYIVTAIFTPAGARVADSLERTLYCGDDGGAASDAEDWMMAWVRGSSGGGAVLIQTTEDGHRVAWINLTVPISQDPGGVRPSAGYPAHGCGAPMVPADIVGAKSVGPKDLFCLGCLAPVDASAADRLRAQTAAFSERKGAAR